jgi:hypothetical protein
MREQTALIHRTMMTDVEKHFQWLLVGRYHLDPILIPAFITSCLEFVVLGEIRRKGSLLRNYFHDAGAAFWALGIGFNHVRDLLLTVSIWYPLTVQHRRLCQTKLRN